MERIVFLLEERSMQVLLEELLHRFLPALRCIFIVHEGKNDLERSIPKKLNSWREPGARFVIIEDNDGADCCAVKDRLRNICNITRNPDAVIRIACQELEAWYFGDESALDKAYPTGKKEGIGNKARFRNPDAIRKPSKELGKLIPEFQKISGARLMSAYLNREGNRSHSFNITMEAIEEIFRSFSGNSH